MKRKILLAFMIMLVIPVIASAQAKEWSLQDCIEYAIQNNIQLKQQEISTQYDASALALSKLALLPTLNGYATHDYNFGRALDETTYQYTENQTVRSNNFGASSNVTLFSGLVNYNTIKSNQFKLLASQQDLEVLKDNISLNIALAYLQILLDQELVNTTMAQVDLSKQQVERTQKMVNAGSLAQGTLLDIEAQEANEELQLTTLQNNLTLSYLNLAQMLELRNTDSFRIVIPNIEVKPVGLDGDPEAIYAVAEKDRPEVLSAQYSLEASRSALSIARGGRSPKLTLSGSVGTAYNDARIDLLTTNRMLFKDQINNNLNYGIGLTLSIPILNGWSVNKNVENAKLSIKYSEYTLEATRKTLYKNITQAFTDAGGALRKYYSSKKAVESMEEAFRYSEQKFNVGLVNAIDYNQAKTNLLNAESQMSQAKYEYIFKTKVLDFYKGLPITLEQIGVISK